MRKILAAIAIVLYTGVYCAATPPKTPDNPIENLTRQIAQTSDDYNLYWSRANHYELLKDFEKAIADYDRALTLESSQKSPYRYLMYFDRAKTYFERAQSSDRANASKDFEKAIADYSQGLALCDGCDRYLPYINRAASYVALERYDLAARDYKAAIKLEPYQPLPYRNLADVYIRLGDYDGAIESYSGEIEHAANASGLIFSVSPHTKRAEIYELIGDYEKAIADLKKTCGGEINNPSCANLKRLEALNGK
ncbi:MAG: tetratricopeptide repeat protein [Helicobacteraceae bacterium]|nr:tetratricopeptide repeat protein [Helicobacteraceae bacterium]